MSVPKPALHLPPQQYGRVFAHYYNNLPAQITPSIQREYRLNQCCRIVREAVDSFKAVSANSYTAARHDAVVLKRALSRLIQLANGQVGPNQGALQQIQATLNQHTAILGQIQTTLDRQNIELLKVSNHVRHQSGGDTAVLNRIPDLVGAFPPGPPLVSGLIIRSQPLAALNAVATFYGAPFLPPAGLPAAQIPSATATHVIAIVPGQI